MKAVVCFGLVLSALCAAGEVFQTKAGELVTMGCGVTSYKNTVEWKHGNDVIFLEGRGLPRKGSTKIRERSKLRQTNLEIKGVTEEDAGTFTCIVDGTPHQHTLIVVAMSVSPSADLQLGSAATLQCRVKGLSPDHTVEWDRPDGSPGGSHTVQLQSVGHADGGLWVCKFSYEGQLYRNRLDVRVKVPSPSPSQKPDVLTESACLSCVDAETQNIPLLLGLSWWMWIIVGVGVLVLVMLMVCIIVLCSRIRKRKRRFQKMNKALHPLKPRQYCQCDRPTAAAAPRYQGLRQEKPQTPRNRVN